MKKPQHAKTFWSGKGFYLALTLVIAGAATASFLAINNMMDSLGTSPVPENFAEEDLPWQDQPLAPAEEKQQGVPVKPEQKDASSKPESASAPANTPASESSAPKKDSTSASASSSASKPASQPSNTQPSAPSQPPASSAPDVSAALPAVPAQPFASPKSGAVLQPFSGDELVYNETLGDWRTHNGMDIAGKAGDTIKAPMAGTVKTAAEDALWGGVVEIEADGCIARVCGLAKPAVKEGQTVALGDKLGKLAEAPAESALPAHLHIEITRDGKLVDPAECFAQS